MINDHTKSYPKPAVVPYKIVQRDAHTVILFHKSFNNTNVDPHIELSVPFGFMVFNAKGNSTLYISNIQLKIE